MAISLYDASVASYLQVLGGVAGFLDKGLSHCQEKGPSPQEILETRLFPDMHPFRYQIQALVHHSSGAVAALKSGVFHPPSNLPAHDYKDLQKLVADARDGLQKLTPAEINARENADVIFEIRDTRRTFTANGFILSFSLPNFHFHATTAYDILRWKGVPVGKRDFMGALRLKS